MAIVAALVLLGGVTTVWWAAGRTVGRPRRLHLAALAAVTAVVVCLLDQRGARVVRLVRWDDWAYFARVPLWLAIATLLAVAWWAAVGAKRRIIGVLVGLVLLYATLEVASPACLPLVAGQLSDAAMGTGRYATEVQQSTGWSCGPAALAWALRLRGMPASEREMALLSATVPLHGAAWPGMVRAAHWRGLTATVLYPATWDQLLAAPKPLLADWRLSAVTSHMIVVIATEPNRVTVGDPMRGELAHTKAEFLARWERGMMTLDEP